MTLARSISSPAWRALAAFAALAAVATGDAGCSRAAEMPAPQASPDRPLDASAQSATQDLSPAPSPVAPRPPESVFSFIARAPAALYMSAPPGDELGNPMPWVQRLPGGGLVVASAYARAHAEAGGPLSVELLGRGFENAVLNGYVMAVAPMGLRWVWSDEALSIVVDEVETGRTGPRIASYKLGASGFRLYHRDIGYRSAVKRGDSVLALQQTAHEVPDSSMYLKGSPDYQNEWALAPARVAVLAGHAVPPSLPRGVCPTAMKAAPDGSLVISVYKCVTDSSEERATGVLRYAPGATSASVAWLSARRGPFDEEPAAISAVSASEIYVGEMSVLATWNGQRWTESTPFPGRRFTSLSRSKDGDLWAVTQGEGADARLVKRARDATTWTTIALPEAPADRLDPEPFEAPYTERSDFVRVDVPPEEQDIRQPVAAPLTPYTVDATDAEIVVLAVADHEVFVLSSQPRGPVARLPSVPTQRAQIARTLKRQVATPGKGKACEKGFYLLPQTGSEVTDGKTIAALRVALTGSNAHLGEGSVEGQRRLVVYGEPETMGDVPRALASVVPSGIVRICGPAVVERPL